MMNLQGLYFQNKPFLPIDSPKVLALNMNLSRIQKTPVDQSIHLLSELQQTDKHCPLGRSKEEERMKSAFCYSAWCVKWQHEYCLGLC
jgi:hypothetical protein